MKEDYLNYRSIVNANITQFIHPMEYNSQTILMTSQEDRIAGGLEDGFLDAEWWLDFSGNEEETREQNQLIKEFVPLGSTIPDEEEQNSREWHDAMDSFGSKKCTTTE